MHKRNLKGLKPAKIDLLYLKINRLLNDLMYNSIYPTDIKESNVLFDKDTLDVKLIDLDDSCTYYLDKRSEEKRNKCLENFKQMKMRGM